jgi:hypothetical protein
MTIRCSSYGGNLSHDMKPVFRRPKYSTFHIPRFVSDYSCSPNIENVNPAVNLITPPVL